MFRECPLWSESPAVVRVWLPGQTFASWPYLLGHRSPPKEKGGVKGLVSLNQYVFLSQDTESSTKAEKLPGIGKIKFSAISRNEGL